jgi:polyphosphate glucokinase
MSPAPARKRGNAATGTKPAGMGRRAVGTAPGKRTAKVQSRKRAAGVKAGGRAPISVLVVDVGGSHVKIMVTGDPEVRRMESGPTMTAAQMARGVLAMAEGWKFEAVAIGFPGPVVADRPVREPHNLGRGWVKFDFHAAFGHPVRMINDAAMQALGSYEGGKMLFLGLGTGLGSTLIAHGAIVPMEIAHLPYRKATFEDYVGESALEREGKGKWRRSVADVVMRLTAAFEPDDVVLGGGNARLLKELPPRCRLGANANAFIGGFRLWDAPLTIPPSPASQRSGTGAPRKTARRRT